MKNRIGCRKSKNPFPIAGLDLSLKRPAVVVIPEAWKIGDWKALYVYSLNTERDLGEAGQTPKELIRRVTYIVEVMASRVQGVEHVFVEQYAFSRSSSSVTKLAELGGALRYALWTDQRKALTPVVAASARKLLLGKLPRSGAKVAVEHALRQNGAPFDNDDEADAFTISNAGLCALGFPYLTLA